jgi:hypothetical protein
MLLAGEWNRTEWIAGAIAATLTTALAELAWRAGRLRVAIPARDLASAWSLPAIILLDFGAVLGSLVVSLARGRAPRGTFVVRELRAESHGPARRRFGSRAWRAYVATVAPNAYVVDLDEERQLVLLHDLVPLRKSEEPIA